MSDKKRIVLSVDKVGKFDQIRIHIGCLDGEGAGWGHRIYGPKLSYGGTTLKSVDLDERDIQALRLMLKEIDGDES